jgi:tetratricopeptide (TPR) repeat protein
VRLGRPPGRTNKSQRIYACLRSSEAILDINETILLDPELAPNFLFSRGLYYAKRGDHDKAIVDYTEAIRLDPTQPHFYVSRASAYRELGDDANAARDEKKAQELKK